ncbi:hypothetical protein AGMMS49545_18580 [Betaproteobacteria bacterium]|nr:hypothetical protein AGMMS49545_18580 [Betaproteobacteria bacterium]GHU41918.1 hypothetical protein AGMMS50289_05830 [Betaproteobacteria bacterium]
MYENSDENADQIGTFAACHTDKINSKYPCDGQKRDGQNEPNLGYRAANQVAHWKNE